VRVKSEKICRLWLRERERETGERSGLWAVKTKRRELQRGKLTMGLFFSVCFLLSSSTTSLLCCVCFFFVFNYYYY
jgi:hypothetical protein